ERVGVDAGRVLPCLPARLAHVPDLAHVHAALDELIAGGDDVRYNEMQAAHRAGLRIGDADADGDRAGRPGRVELDDAERVAHLVVDVHLEAGLLAVELLRVVDVGDRDEYQLELEIQR